MDVLEREIRIKLDILESLAKSQRALARLLESAADVYEASPPLAARLRENLEQLADCQQALARLLVPLRIPRRKKGRPGKPWLASPVRPGGARSHVPAEAAPGVRPDAPSGWQTGEQPCPFVRPSGAAPRSRSVSRAAAPSAVAAPPHTGPAGGWPNAAR